MRILRILPVAWALACAACQANQSVKIDAPAKAGEAVDVAPFGQVSKWAEGGKDYGVIWEDSRDIFKVVVSFSVEAAAPRPQDMRLEYWQSTWPRNRIPRDRPSGSGGSGWLNIGDWFQGKWQAADVNVDVNDHTFTYTFRPVNAKEFKDLRNFAAEYRSTMKLRLVSDSPLKRITAFAAYTDSTWTPLEFEASWGGNAKKNEEDWSGTIEAFNGHFLELTSMGGRTTAYHDESGLGWNSTVRGGRQGIGGRLLYAQPKGYNSFDETVVTIRTKNESFSFSASDLVKDKSIFIPDLGALVRLKGETVTYASAYAAWQKAKANPKTMDLYSRVLTEKEQTFTRAWSETPKKQPQYIPLSFEGGRQHFRLDANGNVAVNRNWTRRIKGKDTPRCKWDGDEITYEFGLPGTVKKRTLVDGCLPMTISEWERDGVHYKQTAFVMPLDGVPQAGQRILADDTLVLAMRLEATWPEGSAREPYFKCSVHYGNVNEQLTVTPDGVGSQKDGTPRLFAANSNDVAMGIGSGTGGRAPTTSPSAFPQGATRTRSVDLFIPFITADQADITKLRSMKFDEAFAAVRAYWNARVAAGTQITTPEPMINDFYKADVSHLLINTEREVGGADRYMPKVGTFHYGVYSNESCMMVSDLDRRGYKDQAQWSLDAWLHYQGSVALPGDFTNAAGEFYGDGGYEAGGYNQHHGWVLWAMGEHYWYTHDKQWLTRAAPGIVKGCEWIIQQRQRTIDEAQTNRMRAIEKGLLPPGSLEDIGDWRCWLSTNTFTWWGMDNAARALEAAGHPEGKRLVAEAKAYHDDLIAAYTEAMVRSPVVRLRDGSWIPKVPSDVHRRGRCFGWITETLEGAIHLIRTGAIPADSRLATWIIKDFEDNLYLSEQYGYKLEGEAFEKEWFTHGGISQQANLLHNPVPYLLRDQPEHYLRAYFNAFVASYFPDTRMMTEHALPNIGDWRGDHYKSSDESNSTYWLRLIFAEERGDELWLGAAVPRYWLADGKKIGITNARTYFGPMSMQLESNVAAGRITMTIDPPTRNAPKIIRARFRHPEGAKMTRCEVDGAPYKDFDASKEWVNLPDCGSRRVVVAYYDRK